jgi:hypothetical protein
MAKAPKEDARSQRERFIEAAQEVGADEDEASFERRLKAVAGGNSPTGADEKPKAEKPRKK